MIHWRAIAALIGGVMIHLTLGTVYTWGNLTLYLISYVKHHGSPDITKSVYTWPFALAITGQACFMWMGGTIEKRFGPKYSLGLGCLIMSGSVLLSSALCKSFWPFAIVYGFITGCGVGITYSTPMSVSMKWLPNHKGLVNGIIVAGFGAGSFIFNQVQLAIINPNNESPAEDGFYSEEQVKNIPKLFLILGGTYLCMQIIGWLLISSPPEGYIAEDVKPVKSDESNDYDNDGEKRPSLLDFVSPRQTMDKYYKPIEALKCLSFWIEWGMFAFGGVAVTITSSYWKQEGSDRVTTDDQFLTWVGSISSVFNAAGRIIWGSVGDSIGFHYTMSCILILMMISQYTFYFMKSKLVYDGYVCLIYFCIGGMFALFPTTTANTFGQKYFSVIYGMIFTSQIVASLSSAIFSQSLMSAVGLKGIFIMVGVCSSISFILIFLFRPKDPPEHETEEDLLPK